MRATISAEDMEEFVKLFYEGATFKELGVCINVSTGSAHLIAQELQLFRDKRCGRQPLKYVPPPSLSTLKARKAEARPVAAVTLLPPIADQLAMSHEAAKQAFRELDTVRSKHTFHMSVLPLSPTIARLTNTSKINIYTMSATQTLVLSEARSPTRKRKSHAESNNIHTLDSTEKEVLHPKSFVDVIV